MFGDHTTESLGSLSVGVGGVSGSGSPTVEMLVRLGVRRVGLIEPDHVEAKNLNRIYGATRRHAAAEVNKARMMKNHIDRIGLGTKVEIVEGFADSPEAIARLATCDVLFGCMDSIEGRDRSEEHTSERQSLMRISYAVSCLQKNNTQHVRHLILVKGLMRAAHWASVDSRPHVNDGNPRNLANVLSTD